MSLGWTYRGRLFTEEELEAIRTLLLTHPTAHRAPLSRLVCERLDWRRSDGSLKDMACRVAMLEMEADGLLRLPPPRNVNGNGKPYLRRTLLAEPQSPFVHPVSTLPNLTLDPVDTREDSHLWNEFVARYHYLGYQPIPGAQQRYFARSDGRILALLGFGAAAWKAAPRDQFIGWTAVQREAKLALVVNNVRYLVLPWVESRHLASKLLSMAARRLPRDWEARYNDRPVLLESFVEIPRFAGTCYKAANWIYVGQTQGRGKRDVHHEATLPKKAIWLYPLARNFRKVLCS